jgi:CheY-like chemotaxis protein
MSSVTPLQLLFIDDDPDDGYVLKEFIQLINPSINFLQLYDGWDAIMHLKILSQAMLPNLIVLDINMRIINGFEFLKVIKGEELLKNIPVIVYSTSTNRNDKTLSLELGALNYYTKPDTADAVEEVARSFANSCV